MDITDKKTRRSGSLSRVRLVFEHGRDRFFVADTTNRFGQHTRQCQSTYLFQRFDFRRQRNGIADDEFVNHRVFDVLDGVAGEDRVRCVGEYALDRKSVV